MPEISSTSSTAVQELDENGERPRHALASVTSANDPHGDARGPVGRAAAVSQRSARRPPSGASQARSHAARPAPSASDPGPGPNRIAGTNATRDRSGSPGDR